jgi:LysM repeat protein
MTVLGLIRQHVNFAGRQIQNVVAHIVAGAPGTPVEGQFWWNSTTHELNVNDGTVSGRPKASDSALLGGQNSAYHLNRANHSGSQLASTISDLATTVQAYRLDQFAAATNPITVPNGTTSGQAVNKGQLDAVQALATAGAKKDPVRLATQSNDTLSGLAARDGVTPVAGDRVLVMAQTTTSANGIYVAASGAWTRAADFAAASTQYPGTTLYVTEGTVSGDKQYSITSDAQITVGTTAMTWGVTGGGAITYAAGNGLQLSTNTFSVKLPGSSGLIADGTGLYVDSTAYLKNKTKVGYVPTTGTDLTINHAFGLAIKEDLIVKVYEVGVGEVLCGVLPSDVNNVVLSFDTTPTTNQYRYSMMGLS